MTGGISRDPIDRLGPYKSLGDVPPCHRLSAYADRYRGHDTWGEFVVREFFPDNNSYRSKQRARLAGRRWKEHMAGTNRHHALARPTDVETWCASLLEEVTVRTAYQSYWSLVEQFYDWLRWRTDHPHPYNPVLMAAAEYEHANRVWTMKMDARYPDDE